MARRLPPHPDYRPGRSPLPPLRSPNDLVHYLYGDRWHFDRRRGRQLPPAAAPLPRPERARRPEGTRLRLIDCLRGGGG